MSSWPDVVSLLATRCLYPAGTSDQRSAWPKGWQNVKLTQSVIYWRGLSDLHAKRTSENLNTLYMSYFGSQRSCLRKTSELQGTYNSDKNYNTYRSYNVITIWKCYHLSSAMISAELKRKLEGCLAFGPADQWKCSLVGSWSFANSLSLRLSIA